MSTREAFAALLAALLFVVGCAASSESLPPPGWLPEASGPATSRGPWGAWVQLTRGSPLGRRHVAGELIACDHDSTWVLTAQGLVAVPNRFTGVKVSTGANASGRIVSERPGTVTYRELQRWARFPQGMPPGMDRTHIKPKPVP
jgi:hypothetical protein